MRSLSFRAQAPALLSVLLLVVLGACGGSGSSEFIPPAEVGRLLENPAGGFFFVDAHQTGQGRSLRLAETAWARLVDVHDVDASGERGARPLQNDVPVRPDIRTDGVDYRLEPDPVGRTALVVLHPRGTASFENALRRAAQELPTLEPKGDDGSSAGPFPFVARNAAIVLRFEDLLDDGDEVRAGLAEAAQVRVGYPPHVRHVARVFFDASHGGLSAGGFHSTRVVIDFTISAIEPGLPVPMPVNPVGLPASLVTTPLPNVSLRLATREDFGSGVFTVLRSLGGRALDPLLNGPRDESAATLDVVRAVRAGNALDLHNGFLPDLLAPSLVGRWAATVQRAVVDPAEHGAFVLELAFETACAKALVPGELLETGAGFLEVTRPSAPPDETTGEIAEVHARASGSRVPPADELRGRAHLWTRLAADSLVAPACFVEVVGAASAEPGAMIPPGARFRLRFDEPMEPESFDPLETLRLFSGPEASATSTIVGRVSASSDATIFDLEPLLPLAHAPGTSERYTLALLGAEGGVGDLAGNGPTRDLPPLELDLDPAAPAVGSGGLSLRFARPDEYDLGDPPGGGEDLRGLFRYDSERGVLRPRPVTRRSSSIDGTSGVTSFMFVLPVGVREPLARLGSRLQTLWRYADAGWNVADETLYDLDVEGLAWAPFSGQVLSDFFEAFEVRLGHAVQLPDEGLAGPGALAFPASGLLDAPARFDDNVLEPGGARAVNFRMLGYRIDPAARFQTNSGTVMLPFPMHVGGALEPFTWRDTALQGVGGNGGGGIPLGIEGTLDPTVVPGSVAPGGRVPSFGLPLLIELRTSPSDTAIALNDFRVAIASFGQLFPTFRVHSTGGRDTAGVDVRVDPDQAPVPRGGFDPTTTPAGQRTRSADPAVYFGQLDTVTRLTRVHTVWFDAESEDPDYFAPLVSPPASRQPARTEVVLEFRGANGFVATDGAELDARRLDVYGDVTAGSVLPSDGGGWTRDIDEVDGARYLQIRITFASDVESGLSPELGSLALAFLRE